MNGSGAAGVRVAERVRKTGETEIRVRLNLDGSGTSRISTGIRFFDHMLDQLARHGLFDLDIEASGDLDVDAHHTVEDAGICLGAAFNEALGDRRGIARMADRTVPLDEALVQVAVDVSGRPYAAIDLRFHGERVGTLPTEMIEHFLISFVTEARISLHVRELAGRNDHHRAEATFKALARALCDAVALDPRRAGLVPSTKGTLTA
ncbi:MAG: imidazoleglycerol-phosphate dehydratase HisB [Dehalococcoidia bacterium]